MAFRKTNKQTKIGKFCQKVFKSSCILAVWRVFNKGKERPLWLKQVPHNSCCLNKETKKMNKETIKKTNTQNVKKLRFKVGKWTTSNITENPIL